MRAIVKTSCSSLYSRASVSFGSSALASLRSSALIPPPFSYVQVALESRHGLLSEESHHAHIQFRWHKRFSKGRGYSTFPRRSAVACFSFVPPRAWSWSWLAWCRLAPTYTRQKSSCAMLHLFTPHTMVPPPIVTNIQGDYVDYLPDGTVVQSNTPRLPTTPRTPTSRSPKKRNAAEMYTPKRPEVPCRECRRRKIGCDKEMPACTSCARRRVPCVYDTKQKRADPEPVPEPVPQPQPQPVLEPEPENELENENGDWPPGYFTMPPQQSSSGPMHLMPVTMAFPGSAPDAQHSFVALIGSDGVPMQIVRWDPATGQMMFPPPVYVTTPTDQLHDEEPASVLGEDGNIDENLPPSPTQYYVSPLGNVEFS
ncbi:hypothetical protein EXIGLDRAFT_440221 [Exidia glandulosa HHB12029]|uniref:Zn(2)-C6 fungal-type domain-containing protein n=1 Tax=Exidia glandulosa HHB12029 TaxID=1314781 RepID=A0A165B794_EXIGL|nr:hypothetical protein EXIGLDRAFT_440221 [Exidia glandulosa HHB12029]